MARTLAIAFGLYLVLSLFIWSKLWTGHLTSTATCGCGDSSLFTWFINWPAYAISHGLNPLYTKTLYYPAGVNLLASTSELAIGVVLAPITWIFGPVASLNAALTLSPALSALAMFFLLRRWVSWARRRSLRGSLYGFSPFVITALTNAHFMSGMAAVPPLGVVVPRRAASSSTKTDRCDGIVLGLLVTLQFFIGVEVLLIMAVMTLVGLMIIVVYALGSVLSRFFGTFGSPGMASRLVGSPRVSFLRIRRGSLLTVRLRFTGRFGRHLSILRRPSIDRFLVPQSRPAYRAGLSHTLVSTGLYHEFGGYSGPLLSNQYFGFGVTVVLVGGLAIWRRDLKLWLFAGLAAASGLLSWERRRVSSCRGNCSRIGPVFENIRRAGSFCSRISLSAVMLGLIVDHTYRGYRQHLAQAGFLSRRAMDPVLGAVSRDCRTSPHCPFAARHLFRPEHSDRHRGNSRSGMVSNCRTARGETSSTPGLSPAVFRDAASPGLAGDRGNALLPCRFVSTGHRQRRPPHQCSVLLRHSPNCDHRRHRFGPKRP